ncbi:MAG: Hsp70 family protein [Rhodococcus sp. (in: high G+C Gram-positive bacteria)]|uniref:Hsp70 family protein n=1 Tax=Rhodococcus sp. TaxID=1831 RepID=UPI003BB78811
MRTSLGISTGASGVGSVLVIDAPDGRTTEYRELAADTRTGIGDLVVDAITLMTQVADVPKPEVVTVSYRTVEQADAIRAAAIREGHHVRLIPETAAVAAYLRTTGLMNTDGAIAIADIGASGMSVSILDDADGTILYADRTGAVGGDAISSRLVEHVRRSTSGVRTRMPVDSELLAARCLGAMETLGVDDTAHIEIGEAGPGVSVTVTRTEFELLVADLVGVAAEFTARVCAAAPTSPRVLVLVGGTSSVPALAAAVSAAFGGPAVTVADPATVAAYGAAHMVDHPRLDTFPLAGGVESDESRSSGRTAGALVGALVVGALVAGYATDQIREPSIDRPVSPAGSSDFVQPATPDAVPPEVSAPTATRIPSFDPVPTGVPSGGTTTTEDEAPPTSVATAPPTTVPDTTGPNTTVPPLTTLGTPETESADRDHERPGSATTETPTPEPTTPPVTTTPPVSTTPPETTTPPVSTTPPETTTPPATTAPPIATTPPAEIAPPAATTPPTVAPEAPETSEADAATSEPIE